MLRSSRKQNTDFWIQIFPVSYLILSVDLGAVINKQFDNLKVATSACPVKCGITQLKINQLHN